MNIQQLLTASPGFTISKLGLYVRSTICCHKNGIDPRTYRKMIIDECAIWELLMVKIKGETEGRNPSRGQSV